MASNTIESYHIDKIKNFSKKAQRVNPFSLFLEIQKVPLNCLIISKIEV